jgi:hypothetical protein
MSEKEPISGIWSGVASRAAGTTPVADLDGSILYSNLPPLGFDRIEPS